MKQFMSLMFVSKDSLAEVAGVGRAATKATLTIGGNGQIAFNSLSKKALGEGVDKIYVAYDKEKRVCQFHAVTPEMEKKYGTKAVAVTLRTSKKSTGSYFGGASLLKSEKIFGSELYDYRASGNQTFDVESPKAGVIQFTVPKGSLVKKEVKPRKKKTTQATAQAVPQVSESAKAAAAGVEADLLIPE